MHQNRKESHKSNRFQNPSTINKNSNAEVINRRTMIKDIPFYPHPTYRPPPKQVRIPPSERPENIDNTLEINIDFEENFPFQEGIISETYKSFFEEPQDVEGLVNTGRPIQNFLPK